MSTTRVYSTPVPPTVAAAGVTTSPGQTCPIAGCNGIDIGQPIDPGGGAPYQWANIRFRHMGGTVTNVLFVDGHAGSFDCKPNAHTTDLLRSNINVNQP